MRPFTYTTHPARILFGRGSLARLPDEIETAGLKRVLVLTTPEQAEMGEQVKNTIGSACAGVYSEARPHTPVATTEKAVEFLGHNAIDGLVSVGGGNRDRCREQTACRLDLHDLVSQSGQCRGQHAVCLAAHYVTPRIGYTISRNGEPLRLRRGRAVRGVRRPPRRARPPRPRPRLGPEGLPDLAAPVRQVVARSGRRSPPWTVAAR